MSNMIQQPPPTISVNGGPGGAPAGPGGAGDPDAADVVNLLRKALDALTQAAAAEKDDIDANAIHTLAAQVSKQIAAEQKLTDDVMGAGPGVKMVRKQASPAGPGA